MQFENMQPGHQTALDLARVVEFSEATAYESLAAAPSAAVCQQLGLRTQRVGSALCVVASGIPGALNLNRVIGLGMQEPVSPQLLDEISAVFAGSGAAFGIELTPQAQPAELKALLRERRWRALPSKAAMFAHDMKAVPDVQTDLRIVRVGAEHAEHLARICCETFAMPPQTYELLRAAHQRPGWVQWMGFAGDEPAGAALSFMQNGVAWSGWAATLPAFRGRRFHAAYLAAALRHAKASGCTWFTAETATGTTEQRDPAYRNLLKLGFSLLYERATHLAQPASLKR
jgi:GNAT superfamily N-acetyltransferase